MPAERPSQIPGYSPHATLAWYWNRFRCMSAAEVGYRAKQKVVTQLQQLGLSTDKRIPEPDLTRRANDFVALDPPVAASANVESSERILSGRLQVFDHEYVYDGMPQWSPDPKTGRVAPAIFGKTLDYRDESQVGDIKYLWEPNRHLHLVALAQAYRLTGERRYLAGIGELLDSWFEQCPYLAGPNWTSSLELAIRLLNWSVVWQLTGGL